MLKKKEKLTFVELEWKSFIDCHTLITSLILFAEQPF
jgi:hypothetical protein